MLFKFFCHFWFSHLLLHLISVFHHGQSSSPDFRGLQESGADLRRHRLSDKMESGQLQGWRSNSNLRIDPKCSYSRVLKYCNWPMGWLRPFEGGELKPIHWKHAFRDAPAQKRKCSVRLKAAWFVHQLYLLYDFSFGMGEDDSNAVLEFWAEGIYNLVLCYGNWLRDGAKASLMPQQSRIVSEDRQVYTMSIPMPEHVSLLQWYLKISLLIDCACFFPQPEGWWCGRLEP